ncbi:hypothetical protein ACF1GW_29015 [Streptomyces achromogenes]|uniref:hypothetical protein n=1 Tax=Streptomyces achromogenes TaxID=67255 RepID=UPI0036F5EC28
MAAVRHEEDDRLSGQELVGTAVMLVVADHETPVNPLGDAMLALLRHPGRIGLLRTRPELVPGAGEEFLRTLPARVPEPEPTVPAHSLRWIGSGIVRGAPSLPVRYRVG